MKNTFLSRVHIIYMALALLALTACGSSKKSNAADEAAQVGPVFNADSAFIFCAHQCAFGPRTMNSTAHEQCKEWIVQKFESYGMRVMQQQADLKGYDGTTLKATNIVASYKPERTERVLLCAHWDSRPWADNDPDSANWRKPVMAANDGASGVAVLLELARLLQQHDSVAVGVDFICFDAEDWGTPQWETDLSSADTWALGSDYWAEHPHTDGYTARYGVLLDMVGGMGARFYQEGFSLQYAQTIVDKVWKAASQVGYGSMFPTAGGGMVTDDHVAINAKAGIPTIDIIPHYPDCEQSSFGSTWHTLSDNMDNIDRHTLQAVGQTLVQVLYSEK